MSVKSKPHDPVPAAVLARWVESQPGAWWSVDGDPGLMSVLDFPCPGDELASALRRAGKDLLIPDMKPGSGASGEPVGPDRPTSLADTSGRKRRMALLTSWADADEGWLLLEDEALVQT
ncbi:MAG: hypothetical protein ACRC33_11980 [Gemmataceae bacterium]